MYSYVIFISLPLSPEMFSVRFLHSTFNTNPFPVIPSPTHSDRPRSCRSCLRCFRSAARLPVRPPQLHAVLRLRGLRDLRARPPQRDRHHRRVAPRRAEPEGGQPARRQGTQRQYVPTRSLCFFLFHTSYGLARKTKHPFRAFYFGPLCISFVLSHHES